MTPEQKLEKLTALYADWEKCTRCGLCNPINRRRNNVVFGEGNPDARLVVVGEAPGDNEDLTGRPFAGKSGEVVDQILASFHSNRDEIFILNIVGCRPTDEKDSRENRKPHPDEVQACAPRVHQILRIIDPYVVLLLGGTALENLTTEKRKITAIAQDRNLPKILVETPGEMVPLRWPAFATFHPSYLLRNWSTAKGGDVHMAYRAWRKAFLLADSYSEIYRGVTPPRRGEDG